MLEFPNVCVRKDFMSTTSILFQGRMCLFVRVALESGFVGTRSSMIFAPLHQRLERVRGRVIIALDRSADVLLFVLRRVLARFA